MKIIDHSFARPQENIAFDEALYQMAEKEGKGEVLRFWESPVTFIVLGRIGKQEDDVNQEAADKGGIEVLRRSSGGGTVVQGPGCLNYSLVLNKGTHPHLNDLRASYGFICGKVVEALAGQGIKAAFHPISDIALEGNNKKI